MIYYPLFLLPLWCGFYWQRGVMRFLVGFLVALAVLAGSLALAVDNMQAFLGQLRLMFGIARSVQRGLRRVLAIPRTALPHSRARGMRRPLRQSGALAAAKEPGHALELLGGGDDRHAVLAREPGRNLHRLVPAAVAPDDLPPESRRPRRPLGRQRYPLAVAERQNRAGRSLKFGKAGPKLPSGESFLIGSRRQQLRSFLFAGANPGQSRSQFRLQPAFSPNSGESRDYERTLKIFPRQGLRGLYFRPI